LDADHNGPHGTCRFTDDYNESCTCPDFTALDAINWQCRCCDGDIGDDLEIADVLIFALFRKRIYRAKARALMPLGPASAGHHKRLI